MRQDLTRLNFGTLTKDPSKKLIKGEKVTDETLPVRLGCVSSGSVLRKDRYYRVGNVRFSFRLSPYVPKPRNKSVISPDV